MIERFLLFLLVFLQLIPRALMHPAQGFQQIFAKSGNLQSFGDESGANQHSPFGSISEQRSFWQQQSSQAGDPHDLFDDGTGAQPQDGPNVVSAAFHHESQHGQAQRI